MKLTMLLLMCLVAVMMLDSSEGWRRRRWRIRLRRFVRRIRVRIRFPQGCVPRRACNPWIGQICCPYYSAGGDKSPTLNKPDTEGPQLQQGICQVWTAKVKQGQCQVKPEVCQANCTGCNPSGMMCPPGVMCPDNCCVCQEGEMLKDWIEEKGADLQDHVDRWLDKMGVTDEQDKKEIKEELLGEGDPDEQDKEEIKEELLGEGDPDEGNPDEDPADIQDDGVDPADDNDKVDDGDAKKKDA